MYYFAGVVPTENLIPARVGSGERVLVPASRSAEAVVAASPFSRGAQGWVETVPVVVAAESPTTQS